MSKKGHFYWRATVIAYSLTEYLTSVKIVPLTAPKGDNYSKVHSPERSHSGIRTKSHR